MTEPFYLLGFQLRLEKLITF